LIALQINNISQQKQDQAFERKMLSEIKQVLEQDLAFFENHLIGYRLQVKFHFSYLAEASTTIACITFHIGGKRILVWLTKIVLLLTQSIPSMLTSH
jgi:hypothetical protein